MSYTLDEWSLPPIFTNPFQITAAPSVAFFIDGSWVGPGLGRVGRLNPANNTVTAWVLPFTSSSPGDLGFQRDYVFISDAASAIVQLNPATSTFLKWNLPFGLGGPRDFAFDSKGNVYFSVSSVNGLWIGRLNDATRTFTVWPIPPGLATPGFNWVEDVAVDAGGNVFFAVLGATSPPSGNKIGCLNPVTNAFLAWPVPNTPNFAIEVDSAGVIVFIEILPASKRVARLTPGSNALREWNFPGDASEFIGIVGTKAFFADSTQNAIIRFTPGQQQAKPLARVNFPPVHPMIATVQPAKGKVAPISKKVTPTTTVIPAVAALFTILPLPTPNSNPRGICANAAGEVFFTEQGGSRIGRLR
jgi:streptogramin lyase